MLQPMNKIGAKRRINCFNVTYTGHFVFQYVHDGSNPLPGKLVDVGNIKDVEAYNMGSNTWIVHARNDPGCSAEKIAVMLAEYEIHPVLFPGYVTTIKSFMTGEIIEHDTMFNMIYSAKVGGNQTYVTKGSGEWGKRVSKLPDRLTMDEEPKRPRKVYRMLTDEEIVEKRVCLSQPDSMPVVDTPVKFNYNGAMHKYDRHTDGRSYAGIVASPAVSETGDSVTASIHGAQPVEPVSPVDASMGSVETSVEPSSPVNAESGLSVSTQMEPVASVENNAVENVVNTELVQSDLVPVSIAQPVGAAEMEMWKEEVVVLKREIMVAEIEKLKAEIEKLKAVDDMKDKWIAEKDRQIAEKDKQIAKLKASILAFAQ